MISGFKIGAQATLQKFTIGYKGNSHDLHGNLNLGAIGATVNAEYKNLGLEFNSGIGFGGGLSWD